MWYILFSLRSIPPVVSVWYGRYCVKHKQKPCRYHLSVCAGLNIATTKNKLPRSLIFMNSYTFINWRRLERKVSLQWSKHIFKRNLHVFPYLTGFNNHLSSIEVYYWKLNAESHTVSLYPKITSVSLKIIDFLLKCWSLIVLEIIQQIS